MARTSKKNLALKAAYDLVEAGGVESVTYDSLAEATGMSKSGLIYHFPSRHELLIALHTFAAENWEAELEKLAGGQPAGELTTAERYHALTLSLGKNDPLAELLLSIHAQQHPDYSSVWQEVNERWSWNPAEDISYNGDLSLQIASMVGLGLWVHDHLNQTKLSENNRKQILDRVLGMIAEATRE